MLILWPPAASAGRRCRGGGGCAAAADKDLERGDAKPVLHADAWSASGWLHDAPDAERHVYGTWSHGPPRRSSCYARDGHATDAPRSAAGGHVHGSNAAQPRHVSTATINHTLADSGAMPGGRGPQSHVPEPEQLCCNDANLGRSAWHCILRHDIFFAHTAARLRSCLLACLILAHHPT